MDKLIIHGKENIVKPGFYMPNRISIAAGRALHQLLDGKVCYLVDPSFAPAADVMAALKSCKAEIENFDFRKTTSLAVSCGVVIAGLIMGIASTGVLSIFGL